MIGVMTFIGCDNECETSNYRRCQIIGDWECVDSRYCENGNKLFLYFNKKNVVVDVDTDSRCIFYNGRYKYSFSDDTLQIMLKNGYMPYTITLNDRQMNLRYLGTISAPANELLPEINYQFKKIK